ncbi:MAG: hypothetical protein HYV07_31885 [Deltaproteobacteria bacterium]|nr:hypothetical protein [Deltaproteobacteria bacterium]
MRLERTTSFLLNVGSRLSNLLRATAQATVLGIIETATSERGRRILAIVALSGAAAGIVWSEPIRAVEPGVVAVRVNRLSGRGSSGLEAGWAVVLPWVHELRVYPAGDRVYRPEKGNRAGGSSPYQTSEGLSVGVDVTVRYSLDPENGKLVSQGLPDDLGPRIIEPVIDAILHRVLAKHTVREIYSTHRTVVESEVTTELSPLLSPDGVLVRSVFLGRVDLPPEYRAGLPGTLPVTLANRIHVRRAGVRAELTSWAARQGAPEIAKTLRARAVDSLGAVNQAELFGADKDAFDRAAVRVGAERWAGESASATGDVRLTPRAPGETCIAVGSGSRVFEKCTYAFVWGSSVRVSSRGVVTLSVEPVPGWVELWVISPTEERYCFGALVPSVEEPGIGYVELAGWTPDGKKLLVARAAVKGSVVRKEFSVVKLETLESERSARSASSLEAFGRYSSPEWQRSTLALK